jgi:AAHS family 4-hydroxybenzoate transporter-like MFS transporter
MNDAVAGISGHLAQPSRRGDTAFSTTAGGEPFDSDPTIDIGAVVEQQKIGWFAVNLVGWTFAAMFFTGFNFAGIAFVVPSLAREWHIAPGAFGSAFGIGIVGMMLGSLFFGYAGDRIGRKRTLVLGGWIFGIVTLASIWAPGITVLAVERFVAGFGFMLSSPTASSW